MKPPKSLFLTACLFGVLLIPGRCADPILHWGFDHELQLIGEPDSSLSENHAVIYGDVARLEGRGVYGHCLELSRKSGIRSHRPVPLGEAWAVSFWFCLDGQGYGDSLLAIEGMRLGVGPDRISLSAKGLPDGRLGKDLRRGWHHALLQVALGGARLYIDGELGAEARSAGWRYPHAKSIIKFSSGSGSPERVFLGKLDEIRFYSGVTSPEDRSALATRNRMPLSFPQLRVGPANILWQPGPVNLSAMFVGGESDSYPVQWRCVSAPKGVDLRRIKIQDPSAMVTTAVLPAQGDYRFEVRNIHRGRQQTGTLRFAVLEPMKTREGKPYKGPWHRTPLSYDDDFVAKWFPPYPLLPQATEKPDLDRLSPPPAPYVHPRVFFGPDDLPLLRRQMLTTEAGSRRSAKMRDILGILPWQQRANFAPEEFEQKLTPEQVEKGRLLAEKKAKKSGRKLKTLEQCKQIFAREGKLPKADFFDPKTGKSYNRKAVMDVLRRQIFVERGFTIPPFAFYEGKMFIQESPGDYIAEAYRCLLEADSKRARELVQITVHSAEMCYKRLQEPDLVAATHWKKGARDVISRYGMGLLYDFLYPWMTDKEREVVRKTIALATAGRNNMSLDAVSAGTTNRGNWTMWCAGDYLISLLSIEGEDGYDHEGVTDTAALMERYLNASIFPETGGSYEGLAKGLLGADRYYLLQKRGYPLLSSTSVHRCVTQFMLNSMMPYGGDFLREDLLGGTRPPRTEDVNVVKYAYPNDPIVDYVFRNAVGHTYPGGAKNKGLHTLYSPSVILAGYWMQEDWHGPENLAEHLAWTVEKSGGLPLSWFDVRSGMMFTRQEWSLDTPYLYFAPRRLGTHSAPSRGNFLICAHQQLWNHHSAVGENGHSNEFSVVTVDGLTNSRDPVKTLAYVENDDATFALADLHWVYAGKTPVTWNETMMVPSVEPWANLPFWQLPAWYDGRVSAWPPDQWDDVATKRERLYDELSTGLAKRLAKKNTPKKLTNRSLVGKEMQQVMTRMETRGLYRSFEYARRSVGMVRGKHPYVLVTGGYKQDDRVREYEWRFRLNPGVRIFEQRFTELANAPQNERGADIVLCPSSVKGTPMPGTPMLLLRVMSPVDGNGGTNPAILQRTELETGKRAPSLVVNRTAADAVFRVLVYPYRHAVDPLPDTQWLDRERLSLKLGGQHDELTYARQETGGLTIRRNGNEILNLTPKPKNGKE